MLSVERSISCPLACKRTAGRLTSVLLWATVILAAVLRLFWLQYGEYQWDDDSIWSAAASAVAHHQLPNQGIASTIGVPNGPFQVYLMMPLAAITHAPLAGMILIALLNTAAVYFLYRFVAEFFGQRPALIAALLFAVSSWAVIYSRHLAVQGMLIPFQVLFFWSLARWLAYGRGRDLVLAFLWLAILSQTYIDGLLHLGTMLLVLVLGWRRLRPLPLFGGAALCGLLLAPYAIGAVLPDLQRFQPVATNPPSIDAQSIQFTLYQAAHTGFRVLARQTEAFPFTTAGFQDWIELFEEALFAAGAIYAVIELVRLARSGKAPQARIYALLLLWLLVPIAVYLRHSEVLSWRHFAVTIPLPAVFTALLLDRLWPWFDAPVLTALSANSLAMAGLYLAVAPTCTTDNVYGLPYQTTFDAAASIERLAVASGTRRVYLDGYPALTPILSSILTREGLDPVWSNPEQGSELAALPAASPPSVYVTLADATPTSQVLRTAFSDSQASAQALPCVGMQLRTYALDPATLSSALEGLPSASLKLAAANGLQLDRALVARRLSPGQPLQAGLVWIWPGGSRPDSSYWAFAHLLDSAGKVVGQTDVPLRPPAGWVAGEQVVSWLPIQVPGDAVPGRYTLEVGIYGEHAVRSELFDASGKPAGDSAVIQPLAVPPPTSASAPVLTPVARGFGDEIELTGYSLSGSQLLLQWQALKAPRLDYTVFIHLLDSSGQLLAQADAQPLEGDFPTTLWQPGETVLDPHQLPALPPGVARIEVGLYYQPALKRLPGDPVLIPSS